MSQQSSIEWTDATWNPTRGCTKISPGCKHCYAETFAERFRGVPGHPYERGFDPRLAPDKLAEPLKWKKPRRIFVNSMSDLFHEDVPDEYIAAVFGVMAACPQHTFQVLTKRAERLPEWFDYIGDLRAKCLHEAKKQLHRSEPWRNPVGSWPLSNVWLGVSVEDQPRADERLPHLVRVPAAVRFLSVEPMLGAVDFSDVTRRSDAVSQLGQKALSGIGWVIVGGESGHGARPFDLAWARCIVAQCKAAGVPVFVKQLGARPVLGGYDQRAGDQHHDLVSIRSKKGGDWNEWPIDLRVREFPRVEARP